MRPRPRKREGRTLPARGQMPAQSRGGGHPPAHLLEQPREARAATFHRSSLWWVTQGSPQSRGSKGGAGEVGTHLVWVSWDTRTMWAVTC